MSFQFITIVATFIFSTACSNNPGQQKYVDENLQKQAIVQKPEDAFSHAVFDNLLKTHVTASGEVNYKGFKKDEATLDNYLKSLPAKIPDKTWSKDASLSYWVNTYNAFTIKLILKNYPLKSITDLDSGKPWDVVWIELGGKKYSLNNIENDIIRPQFKDPRIHFALNCAAKSCPPLINAAFTEANINVLLDSRAKNFINSSANDMSATSIKISKIFDWYKADFGNVITFLNKYSDTKIYSGAKIKYKSYDWNLNGK